MALFATRSGSRGFSLVELMVTLVIFGLVLGFSIPYLQSLNQSHQLKGATENFAAQLRMAREIAIATNTTQTMHCTAAFVFNGVTSDYHIHNANVGATWRLPPGIVYTWLAGTVSSYTFASDGRLNPATSGLVIFQDRRGDRDTVSVQVSGLVLTK
jgi:prepilin-type N-terminal cleavage/methylation domain-containing protein